MDDIASSNRETWEELVRRDVLYSRPYLNLTPETARQRIDLYDLIDDVRGKDVLLLAAGGGQQSAVFALLGARVHVIDMTEGMLAGDRLAAQHYQVEIAVHQGDMRDLSRFEPASFDLVWQPYSINYVPDSRPVFREVARVLRPGGYYHLQIHNPYYIGMAEQDWNGSGYPVRLPYEDGAEIADSDWEFADSGGSMHRLPGPRTFRHTLAAVTNELSSLGFVLLKIGEEINEDADSPPGTWEHFTRTAPPWLTLWWNYQPDLMKNIKRQV